MPKMKSKRSLVKRVKVTASQKLKRHHAYRRHIAIHKSTKQKRHLRNDAIMHNSDYKREKSLLGK